MSSILRYAIIFWGNSTDGEEAFKAQKKCVRAICNLRLPDSCRPHFKTLNILTLPSLYIFELAIFVKSHPELFERFTNRRHRNKIKAISHSSALYDKNILGMAPKIFNKIPNCIRNICDLRIFKKELKIFLIKNTYYSISEFLSDYESNNYVLSKYRH